MCHCRSKVYVNVDKWGGRGVDHLRPVSIVGGSSDGNTAVAPAVEIGRPIREDFQLRQREADLVVDQRVLGGFGRACKTVTLG